MAIVKHVSLLKIAVVGGASLIGLFAGGSLGCTPKGTRATRLASDDPLVESEKVISEKKTQELQEFVTEFKKLRGALGSQTGMSLGAALRQLRADLQNQDVNAATGNLGSAIGSIETLRRANELFSLLQTSLQEAAKPKVFTKMNPLWDASGASYLDLVKKPNQLDKYNLWESQFSTNPFDVLALAQDPSAQLLHVEKYSVPSKQTRPTQRGTTVFITLSATGPEVDGLSQAMQTQLKGVPPDQLVSWREARGVCSDLLAPVGMSSGMATVRRVFEFLTPTASNAAQPQLGEARSPVLALLPPELRRDGFVGDILKACDEQKLKTNSLKKVELVYDVVAAFKLPDQGIFRVLKATLRFGTPSSAAQQQGSAQGIDLYWLQQELVSELPQPVAAAKK